MGGIFGMALAIPVIGTLLSAIGTGPGLELTLNSIRTGLSAGGAREGMIPLSALATLDPTRQALVPPGTPVATQDPHATAGVREFTPGHYRIHYKCATASLLRVGNSYFPGWTAESGGRTLPVIPVDHALLGVVAPAGEADLVLNYHSTYFLPSALVSLIALATCAGLLVWQRRARP